MEGSPVGDCYPGKVVGNYTLQEQIGKGSFGSVFKGVDRRQSGFCAIKIISRAYMFDKDEKPTRYKECFDREVHAMRMIKHPKIIKLREKLQSGNNYYLVLDYCEDGDLSQLIKSKGPMTEGDALDAVKQLATGFMHLHRLGIMHRDFKPANVFIHRGNFIIGDLGMAKQASATTSKVGTPITMAPEVHEAQILGQQYDSTVDLFSLGVTFYYMLFKEWPCKPTLNDKREASGARLVFPRWKKISQTTQNLLRRMIATRDQRMDWEELFGTLNQISISKVFLSKAFDTINQKLFALEVSQIRDAPHMSKFAVHQLALGPEQPEPSVVNAKPPKHEFKEIQEIANSMIVLEKELDDKIKQEPVEVQFWRLEMSTFSNLTQFFLAQLNFMKQIYTNPTDYSSEFCALVYQLFLALQAKARFICNTARDLLTQKFVIEDFPKIDNYLKTQHAKTVLEDLENFRKSALERPALDNEFPSTELMRGCEAINRAEAPQHEQFTPLFEQLMRLFMPLVPRTTDLKLEDFEGSPTMNKMLLCVRIYQMIYAEDELPTGNYYGESGMAGLVKKNLHAHGVQLHTEWNEIFRKPLGLPEINDIFDRISKKLGKN